MASSDVKGCETALREVRRRCAGGRLIAVDYTHPSAVNANVEFYSKNGLNFVMGTTGGDRSGRAGLCARLCAFVYFFNLHITAQSDPVVLIVFSARTVVGSHQWGINDCDRVCMYNMYVFVFHCLCVGSVYCVCGCMCMYVCDVYVCFIFMCVNVFFCFVFLLSTLDITI